ncbi:type IX secretion system membrane protein PorP/SprF [Fulvivirga sedimenti]|uniref:Type IX secretion system membrane protein PorP/SprF n=1 Tax=Fulvivirga sedimenti TaxID=2879465 RepID=A0A9X1KVC2_9BACT|nr:type IX secretion system membrane protein PorP/SprF [Fulvivirga sedimenti]MCA6073595.1 type IX secretion system membrane protein PorP/SprF [Fulvivirga sedimenti]
MMKKFFTIGVLVLSGFFTLVQGQDPQFSQYYSAPLYLNPAFAGTGAGHRFVANYRNQWPNISNGFVTYAFSYDYNIQDLKSGVGFIATADRAGSAALTSTTLGFVYSYKVQLSNKWIMTPGLYFGYGHRDIDLNKLVFGDQLAFTNDGQVPTSDPGFGSLGSASYFDFGAGFLIYNSKFWLGFSSYHINEPNRSLLGDESAIPIKNSFHGGVKLPLYSGLFAKEKIAYIAPSFVYKSQGRFDQLDIGLHFLYQPVMVGLWYRGIPLKQNVADNISQDAVALILGLQFSRFEFGYSYDFTISELGPSSSGAHELSLKYDLEIISSSKAKKPMKFIPCPTFIHDN